MPGQDNNPSAGIPPEFLKRLQITPEDQLQQDIRFVKNLLPHYVIQESEKKGSMNNQKHCMKAILTTLLVLSVMVGFGQSHTIRMGESRESNYKVEFPVCGQERKIGEYMWSLMSEWPNGVWKEFEVFFGDERIVKYRKQKDTVIIGPSVADSLFTGTTKYIKIAGGMYELIKKP